MIDDTFKELGDMPPEEFREAAHRVAEITADYLENLESYSVLPDIEPGSVRSALPATAPERGEPLDDILADYQEMIVPKITHWQHPGFLAYFSSVACGPGILGEWLAGGLNSNVMFWQNAPSSTELEETVVSWLRQMLGLPEAFDGMFTDTASISTLNSLVAARHADEDLAARQRGIAGRPETGRLRIYTSAESHSSIEKAAIVIGVGREGVRKIEVDEAFRMKPDALVRAIREDRGRGWRPIAVVATLGTTSTTSLDPVDAIATVCEQEGLWLHVDAAYGGAAGLVPEWRSRLVGWERADSIVVNAHKWMFAPFDASLLLFRRPAVFRDAFSLVAEYMKTPDTGDTHNFNEYGVQLGRRFRALKLWIMIRYFGREGFAARLREHRRLALAFAEWIDAAPCWTRVAPVPLACVCFRFDGSDEKNAEILEYVNRSGGIYLSSTRLRGEYVLRMQVGNPRTKLDHVRRCWKVLQEAVQ